MLGELTFRLNLWREHTLSARTASIAAFVLAGVVALPPAAIGCGESLFRVGRGVSYREYQAPLPCNILMVTRTDNEKLVAEWLSHTGHNVQAVNDPGRVGKFLGRSKFDIVLAEFRDRNIINTQESTTGSAAKYIPIAETGEDAEARAEYRHTLTSETTPRELLKAIHQTLKSDSNRVTGT
jgi:hypothetical protein